MSGGESPVLTLYANSKNKNAYKALIVAEYLGITIAMPASFQMGKDNKTPEFLKLNPQGKVPVLETPEGPIWESNAIARYVAKLAENKLLGTTIHEQALVDQWIDFATTEVDKFTASWLFPLLGFQPRNVETEQLVISQMERALTALDGFLDTHSVLVGDHVTLADIVLVCNLYMGFLYLFTREFSAKFPNVEKYFWTLSSLPEFRKVMGEFTQGEKLRTPVPAEKVESVTKDSGK